MINIEENLKSTLLKSIEGLEIVVFSMKKVGVENSLKELLERTFDALNQIKAYGRGYTIFVVESCIIRLKDIKSEISLREFEILFKLCYVLQLTLIKADTIEQYDRLYQMEKLAVFLAKSPEILQKPDTEFGICFSYKHDEMCYSCYLYVLRLTNKLLGISNNSKYPESIKSICKDFSNKLEMNKVNNQISHVDDTEIEKFFSDKSNLQILFLERNLDNRTIDSIFADINQDSNVCNQFEIKNEKQPKKKMKKDKETKVSNSVLSTSVGSDQANIITTVLSSKKCESLDDVNKMFQEIINKSNQQEKVIKDHEKTIKEHEKTIKEHEKTIKEQEKVNKEFKNKNDKLDKELADNKLSCLRLKKINVNIEQRLSNSEHIYKSLVLRESIREIIAILYRIGKIKDEITFHELVDILEKSGIVKGDANKKTLLKGLYILQDLKQSQNETVHFDNEASMFTPKYILSNVKSYLKNDQYTVLESILLS